MSWFYGPVAALLSSPLFLLAAWLHQTPIQNYQPTSTEPVFCTMEAKLCPDGSYVGRTGPKCEFAACPGATSTPVSAVKINEINPASGAVGATVTILGDGLSGDNTIHFGSGVILHVAGVPAVYACPMIPAGATNTSCGAGAEKLTFTVPSSLSPACAYSTPRCMIASQEVTPGTYPISVTNENGTSNTLLFTVTAGTPTASAPVIYSITPTAGPTGTTVTIDGFGFTSDNTILFGGGVAAHVAGGSGVGIMCALRATNCHPGINQSITFTVPNSIGANCHAGEACPMYMRLVTPGVYAVEVENDNGTSNAVNFTVTGNSGTSGNGAITISGVDAPASIPFGTPGTWTVHATVPNGAQLHYSVVWGDEGNTAAASIAAPTNPIQTSASFSHTYQRAGTYTPTFTVSDDNGHSATVSATVVVTPWY